MYYSRFIAERIVHDENSQRNVETKALDKYFPCDSGSVCTTIGFISGRIVQDDKGQRNTKYKIQYKSIEQLVVSCLKECMYYSSLYCRENCSG